MLGDIFHSAAGSGARMALQLDPAAEGRMMVSTVQERAQESISVLPRCEADSGSAAMRDTADNFRLY